MCPTIYQNNFTLNNFNPTHTNKFNSHRVSISKLENEKKNYIKKY